MRKIHDNTGLAEDYLLDLIDIIKDEAFHGIKMYNESRIKKKDYSKDDSYGEGYRFGFAHAYSRVISLMLQQAESFCIPLSDLGLDGVDWDKDLIPGV